jgi:hypothetical protein
MSVLVVDAGVKADAAEATRRGAKDWKRILKMSDKPLERVGCVDPRSFLVPLLNWNVEKSNLLDAYTVIKRV